MDARREGRAEGIIKSGLRHLLRNEVLIQDTIVEMGYDYAEAKRIFSNFDNS